MSAEVFAAWKVTDYGETGKSLVQTVDIRQTGLVTTEWSADIPKKITLKAGEIVTVNLDIDTGIR